MPFPLLCCCAADGAADGADVVVPHIESALGMDESPTPMYDFKQAACREPCGPGAPIVLAQKQPDFPWGVELEMTPEKDVLIIASIRDQVGELKTPMGVHNFSVPDEAQVLPGDCVVKVNDKSDAASMIRLMQTETELTLTTKRPVVHKTVVLKRGMPLGLSLKFVDSGASVFIGTIENVGAVATGRVDMRAGDRIIEVNGISTAAEMVAELKTSATPEITIARLR